MAEMILPVMYAHGGIGVPRIRFRIPLSLAMAVLMARFVYVADTAANTPRPGT